MGEPMNDTTDKKRKSGETREELDSWLSKEEENCSKKRKEEKDSSEKERREKKEELNKKPSSSDIDKKLQSECKKNKKLTRLKRTCESLRTIKLSTKKKRKSSSKKKK